MITNQIAQVVFRPEKTVRLMGEKHTAISAEATAILAAACPTHPADCPYRSGCDALRGWDVLI